MASYRISLPNLPKPEPTPKPKPKPKPKPNISLTSPLLT